MNFTLSDPKYDGLAADIAKIFDISDGELPTEIRGYRRKSGKIYRLDAFYPNRWRMRVNLNGKLEVTSYSCHLALNSRVSGK